MKLYAKQAKHKFLISTDGDANTQNPKIQQGAGLLVDTRTGTVQRVKSVPKLLAQSRWEPITGSDPTLDVLVQRVPALRRHRGIEIRLPNGAAAWILWRQWSSDNAAVQALLMETTGQMTIPAYEPDGDYFLATQAMALLGGEVLDPPRTTAPLSDTAY
jgi:hypothetical protein